MSSLTAAHSVQIWDNAVFDGPTEGSQWLPLKENLDPNPRIKEPPVLLDIDSEINEIEKEICRLSKKLKLLKIKKADSKAPAGSRGRIVPAKFMKTPTPPVSRTSEKKIQESPGIRRRGLSLGPMEIYGLAAPLSNSSTGQRKPCLPKLEGVKEKKQPRGTSLGPAEILSGARGGGQLRKMSKIQEVEEKPTARRRSTSTSPWSRKPAAASKVSSELRRGVSTAKKAVGREEGPMQSIKPKVLFQESKTPAKRSGKVRIVASRYSLVEPGSKRRKWSLPEEDGGGKEEKLGSGGRSLSLGGPNVVTRCCRPMHLHLDDNGDEEERRSSPSSVTKMGATLPRIRTVRCAVESPRDSGCAKRVADLVGKRSCFANGEILNLDGED